MSVYNLFHDLHPIAETQHPEIYISKTKSYIYREIICRLAENLKSKCWMHVVYKYVITFMSMIITFVTMVTLSLEIPDFKMALPTSVSFLGSITNNYCHTK